MNQLYVLMKLGPNDDERTKNNLLRVQKEIKNTHTKTHVSLFFLDFFIYARFNSLALT
jgi:hypothetical protein